MEVKQETVFNYFGIRLKATREDARQKYMLKNNKGSDCLQVQRKKNTTLEKYDNSKANNYPGTIARALHKLQKFACMYNWAAQRHSCSSFWD